MNPYTTQFYRHSGKFAPHSVLLVLIAPIAAAYPLGLAYAYLIKWIPFIYLNALLTLGYGLLFGWLAGWVLKLGRVRNNFLAILTGLYAGLAALYFNWSGHIHTLIEDAPAICPPRLIFAAMSVLYEHGSWGLRSGGNVTDVMLAGVWVIEALIILGAGVVIPYRMISRMPFCEKTQAWLDEVKQNSTFDVFTDPNDIAAFQAGDLSPISRARKRIPANGIFGRIIIKHSSRCEEFCTVSIHNVTETTTSDGKTKETVTPLITDLVVPKSFLDGSTRFEEATAAEAAV